MKECSLIGCADAALENKDRCRKHRDIVYDPPLKNCKSCIAEFGHCQRPAPYAGPRCRTCHLAKRNADRRKTHRSTVETKYNLPAGGYDALKEFQGGGCGICGPRARGVSRNLAVDHDHKHCAECAGNGSCGNGVRGLLCGRCNSLLAHIRDDIATAQRIFEYLVNPPYKLMNEELLKALVPTVGGHLQPIFDDFPGPQWDLERLRRERLGTWNLPEEPPYTGSFPEDQG